MAHGHGRLVSHSQASKRQSKRLQRKRQALAIKEHERQIRSQSVNFSEYEIRNEKLQEIQDLSTKDTSQQA